MLVVVVVSTDPVGLGLLRRHPRFEVMFAAPSGTEVQTSAADALEVHGGTVQKIALTVLEAAESVGLSERKLRELIARGELQVFHVGRSTRIRVTDLEVFITKLVEAEEQQREARAS
jgi:excisionase family DNA binding protein